MTTKVAAERWKKKQEEDKARRLKREGDLIIFVNEEIKRHIPGDPRSATDLIIWYACYMDAESVIDNETNLIAEMFRDGIKPKTLEDFFSWYHDLDGEDLHDFQQQMQQFYLGKKE